MDFSDIFTTKGLQALRDFAVPPEISYGPEEWIVVGRVEDERAEGRPPEQWQKLSEFRQMIESFDPEVRRIPVVAGFLPGRMADNGPGHHSPHLPPMGEVIDLSTDGLNLHALIRGIIDPVTKEDRVAALKAEGFTERSLRMIIDKTNPERGWQIGHVALLSMAEFPAVANMPRLSSKNPDKEWNRYSSIGDGFDKRDCRLEIATDDGEELLMPLTKQDFQEVVGAAVDPVMTLLQGLDARVTAIETQLTAVEEVADEAEEKAEEAVEIVEEVAEVVADVIATVPETDALVAEVNASARMAEQMGKEPGKILRIIDALDAATITKRESAIAITAIESLPVIIGDRVMREVRTSDGGDVFFVDSRNFSLLTRDSKINEAELPVLIEATKRATRDDGTIDFATQRRLIYQMKEAEVRAQRALA